MNLINRRKLVGEALGHRKVYLRVKVSDGREGYQSPNATRLVILPPWASFLFVISFATPTLRLRLCGS
jgi:hypothetical protein